MPADQSRMQKRTRVVVSGGLVLALIVTFAACSGKRHEPASTATAAPAADDGPEGNSSSAADSSPEDPVDVDPFAATPAFPELADAAVRPPPPKDPETRAKLETKYREVPPERMQAALDSLLEVLAAQTRNRIQDKDRLASRSDLSALSDEVGWLSEHCKR
jgi:type IV secretory pathway VirB10-like protein